ncbi:Ribonuclease H-like superfamily [Sesbania bispinosa]|nr:Ribonuclease H-like superfamily [Sesbania bispinosa]
MQEFYQANYTGPPTRENVLNTWGIAAHWKFPPSGVLKCNVDATWNEAKSTGACAVVVRDHTGALLSGSAKLLPASSPMVVEACALRKAILLAYNLDIQRVAFKSDNLFLIEACRKERVIGEIELIIADILTIGAGFIHPGFSWTQRNGNEVAHFVARARSRDNLPMSWVACPPPWLRSFLLHDAKVGAFLNPQVAVDFGTHNLPPVT